MSENQNYVEYLFDNQKKMYDFWQDSVTMLFNPKEKVEDKKDSPPPNIMEKSFKSTQDFMKKWVDFSSDFYSKGSNSFSPTYPQDIFNKMLNGANLYQNLNKFWEDLKDTFTGKESAPLQFYTRWNEEYLKMVSNNFIAYLPEQIKIFFKEPQDVYKMFSDTNLKYLNPWIEGAQEFQSLLLKSMTGDKNSFIDFNRLWNEKFSSSYGKIFTMPQFSMNREQIQKQMHSVNAHINFSTSMNEFIATMSKVYQETFMKIIKDYQEMVSEGTNPKTFKEFYEYWLHQNEAAYQNLFGTDEFSKLISQLLDAGVSYKKNIDDLLEKQLKFLPFPTKTDMDSVYKTLDTLKRDVRALKKEIAALEQEKGKEEGTKGTNTGKKID